MKAFTWAIAKKSDRPNTFNSETCPGDKWFRNFKKRQNVTNRKPDNVDRVRSRMASMTISKQHFNLLEEIIDRLNLSNKPSSIFNCAESMIAIDRRTGKVVVSRKTKQAYAETKGTRDHITANAFVSASGSVLPPHIIFQQAFPSGLYSRDGPDCAIYSISRNVYTDSELFYGFLDKLFIPHTESIQGPKLLILDGHGSHLSIDLIDLCRRNNIFFF